MFSTLSKRRLLPIGRPNLSMAPPSAVSLSFFCHNKHTLTDAVDAQLYMVIELESLLFDDDTVVHLLQIIPPHNADIFLAHDYILLCRLLWDRVFFFSLKNSLGWVFSEPLFVHRVLIVMITTILVRVPLRLRTMLCPCGTRGRTATTEKVLAGILSA